MLLRAMEEGEIQPLGSETREAVDVRLITATDADLEDEARRERFRSPLLRRQHRLVMNGFGFNDRVYVRCTTELGHQQWQAR
jgi:DNA-binding NtrC family response regulator